MYPFEVKRGSSKGGGASRSRAEASPAATPAVAWDLPGDLQLFGPSTGASHGWEEPNDLERQRSMEAVHRALDHISWHMGGCVDQRWVINKTMVRHTGRNVVVMATGGFSREFAIKLFADQASFLRETHCYSLLGDRGTGSAKFLHAVKNNRGNVVVGTSIKMPSYIVMERAVSLASWVSQSRPPRSVAILLLSAVAHTLVVLHRAGLSHRNVTPRNILWRPAARTWQLIDFAGVGRRGEASPLVATTRYIAPEHLQQLRTGRRQDAELSVDVYSLGVIALELLSGTPIVPNGTPPSKIEQMLLREHHQSFPHEEDGGVFLRMGAYGPLVRRMLDRTPAARPTAQMVCDALREGAREIGDLNGDKYARLDVEAATSAEPLLGYDMRRVTW